jgi:hypothetical protein
MIGGHVGHPSKRQLERHIQQCAQDSANIVFVNHARDRMRLRKINDPMVLETLRKGLIAREPEPDPKADGLRCVMERYVSGVNVGVVVLVDHPAPDLTVITVMEVKKG